MVQKFSLEKLSLGPSLRLQAGHFILQTATLHPASEMPHWPCKDRHQGTQDIDPPLVTRKLADPCLYNSAP